MVRADICSRCRSSGLHLWIIRRPQRSTLKTVARMYPDSTRKLPGIPLKTPPAGRLGFDAARLPLELQRTEFDCFSVVLRGCQRSPLLQYQKRRNACHCSRRRPGAPSRLLPDHRPDHKH
jgi:hypothetical protein